MLLTFPYIDFEPVLLHSLMRKDQLFDPYNKFAFLHGRNMQQIIDKLIRVLEPYAFTSLSRNVDIAFIALLSIGAVAASVRSKAFRVRRATIARRTTATLAAA